MPITRTPIFDDSGQGVDGTIIDNAWKQQFYDQIDALAGTSGVWTARPFVASNYSAEPPLTWTPTAGQIVFDRYTYVGNTLLWALKLDGITLGGTAAGWVKALTPGTRLPHHVAELAIVSGYTNAAFAVHKVNVATAGHILIRRMDYSPIQPGIFGADLLAMMEVV